MCDKETLFKEQTESELTHQEQVNVLKFIAQYPFEDFEVKGGYCSQILKVDFAALEITLRDFVEYNMGDILGGQGFTDVGIKNKWRYFVDNKMYKGEGCRANALKE